ncbi:PD-(D/E)XK nuclease family protein [Vibrio mediterranei]|uniref:PD-(D/E)XK nuclease family protein n=1 Tax=Vibrio mediterranei TaxID=689 RepID=UPI00148CECD9|nr:PD-(D/E)XK nuclease family protein [Vibrio mediterranei]NOH31084.1 hypothetical protein [Vibrio mediterranei]
MNNSLLVNVSKYASSHQKSPIENFITEAFAWLLRNDVAVREAMTDLLFKQGQECGVEIPHVGNSDLIDTQVNFDGKYPDMLWGSADNTSCLIFEHKVWSELHDGQLYNYRKYAEEKLDKSFAIVLITGHSGQHKQNPDLAFCWYQVAEAIERIEGDSEKGQWIRKEFIQLLRSNGLAEFSPLNPLSISYYYDSKNIDRQLYDIAKITLNKQWPIQQLEGDVSYNKPAYQRHVGVNERCGRYDSWRRIGLEFNNVSTEYPEEGGWNPGVFCGFLIDCEDHVTHDLMKKEPLAVLIIDVDKPLHSKLTSSSLYKELVRELTLPNGWKLSDRIVDSKNENPWHPLIVYRSLSGFIGNTTTLGQQAEVFFEQMSGLQNALINSRTFLAFCEEMQKSYEESL